MSAVFEYGQRTWAADLLWVALANPSQTRREIRDRGKQLQMDRSVVLGGLIPRAGFMSTAASAGKITIWSMAAAIMLYAEKDSWGGTWMGVWELPGERFYLLSVLDTIPESDVIGTREEVQERFRQEVTKHPWRRIVAPAEWAVPETTAGTIAQILPLDAKGRATPNDSAEVKAIANRAPNIKLLVFGSLAGIAAVLGFSLWRQHLDQIAVEKDRAIALARQQLARAQVVQDAPERLPHPWPAMPTVDAVVASCSEAIRRTPLTPGGWQIEEWACADGRITAKYTRHGSTISALRARLPGVQIDLPGEKATWSAAIPMPLATSDEALLVWDEAVKAIQQRAQRAQVPVSVAEVPPPPPPKDKPPPIQDWRTLSFRAETALAPRLTETLFALPGARITKISARSPSNGPQFVIEGNLYAK